jgi:hypothetical protein
MVKMKRLHGKTPNRIVGYSQNGRDLMDRLRSLELERIFGVKSLGISTKTEVGFVDFVKENAKCSQAGDK